MKVVAGVDSSTQSCTVVLRHVESGEMVATGRSPHPPTTPPVSEQDPNDWWTALADAMHRACAAAEVDVVAMSIAAQAHGLVPVGGDGQVLRKAKLWNDTTSATEARELVGRLGAEQWVRRTGSVPPGAFTISKLLWLSRREPTTFSKLAQVLLPHDWLMYKLTGNYLTDAGDASGTGYYSPTAGTWDLDLLDLVDPSVDWSERLPHLVSCEERAGTANRSAAERLGLGTDVAIAAGTADNQAAAIGMGTRVGDVVVSLGTSGAVFARSKEPVHDVSGAFNGNADATGQYLPVLCTLNAAKVTDTFARLLDVSHDELSRLALAAPVHDPNRPVLAAYLDGERVPDRPAATGTLSGLRTDTTREQVARAAFEGVLAGLVRGIDALQDLGVPTTEGRLAITGGGARAAAYGQLLADLTGRPVHRVAQTESAAAGAAIQAAAIATGTDIDEVADQWGPQWEVYAEPRPGADSALLLDRYDATTAWEALENPSTTFEMET